MSIAQQVRKIILDSGANTFTLYGGYGFGKVADGQRGKIEFPGASIRNEKKDKKGRVTYLEAHYKDGSYLVYRYSNDMFTLTPYGGRLK